MFFLIAPYFYSHLKNQDTNKMTKTECFFNRTLQHINKLRAPMMCDQTAQGCESSHSKTIRNYCTLKYNIIEGNTTP